MSAVFIPYLEVFMNYAGIKEYDIANGPGTVSYTHLTLPTT